MKDEYLNSQISVDRLDIIHNLALRVAPKKGFGAEVGVYRGGSLKIIAEAMKPRMVYGFDTFAGMPAKKWIIGEPISVGDFSETNLQLVQDFLLASKVTNVKLFSGLFPEVTVGVKKVVDAKYAFVHLDADYYTSTKEALEFFWPRMVPGGVIVLDDYEWEECPGVKLALLDMNFSVPIYSVVQYQAYIFKPEE